MQGQFTCPPSNILFFFPKFQKFFLKLPQRQYYGLPLYLYILYFIAKMTVLNIFIRGELPDNPK